MGLQFIVGFTYNFWGVIFNVCVTNLVLEQI